MFVFNTEKWWYYEILKFLWDLIKSNRASYQKNCITKQSLSNLQKNVLVIQL